MRKTSDAVEILMNIIRDDPEAQQMVREAEWQCMAAQMVYDTRTQAGLSQKELAERAGVEADVIAQIEDADYEEPIMPILQRIAENLHCRLELHLVPDREKTPAR